MMPSFVEFTFLVVVIHLIILVIQGASLPETKRIDLQAAEWYRSTVNYWPFEGVPNRTVTDYTGSNNGKVNGGFATVSGIVGSALALSGNDSWVDFGVVPISCLNKPSTCDSGFTIAFWLKIPEFQGNKIILQLGEHRYSRGFTVWTRKSTKKNIGFSINTRLRKYQWLQEWNSGDWNHIALKWDNNTQSLQIFVNCSLAQVVNTSEPGEPVEHDKPSRLILGASQGLKKNIKLLVDEFAIWDRLLSNVTLCELFHIHSVNGNYSEWSEFSACSVTCGNGTMKRTRTCTSPPPKNRGRNCSSLGAAEEFQFCFLRRCPIHGGYSEWSSFSNCSKSCGTGIKRRSRKCSNPEPQHGGSNCSHLGLSMEVKNCSEKPCPINGGYSTWTEFSLCTVSCGSGKRQRTRNCSNPKPIYGGQNCSHLGPNNEVEICSTNLCPIHGGYSDWSNYSDCTKSCGNGSQVRTRNCSNPEPKHGGKDCLSLGSHTEIINCNTHRCPIDGGYTPWTDFSKCTVSCGNGTRQRTRNCSNPNPMYGGQNCSHLGPNIEIEICSTNLCPIHGGYSDWSNYSDCTKSCGNGSQIRTRKCSNPEPKYGGRSCLSLGSHTEIINCNTHHCPIDGGYTQWTDFSKCTVSCGNGTRQRSRNCSNPKPMHGGQNCSHLGPNIEVKTCNTNFCPIHGGYTEWSQFSECTKSCGNGSQNRTRNCSNPEPKHGGRNCFSLGSDTEIQHCNTHHCPIDGGYTPWTEFSECSKSCGIGEIKRTRSCSNPKPRYGGSNCSHLGVSVEVQRCFLRNCPVHGGFSDWSNFGECTRSCGVGLKNRTRHCTNPEPKHGGDYCTGDFISFKVCNVLQCPINGGYTKWSVFSACSKSCANGTMKRIRNCSEPPPGPGGRNCSFLGPAEEIKECNTFPCPVNGSYSAWSNFSVCSKSCGNGTMVRTRTCTNPEPKHGGRNCSFFGPSKEIKSCNIFPCPIHGNFSSWSFFSVCSKSCGNGTRSRTRNCSNPFPKHGGKNCSLLGPLIDVQQCNVFPCPEDGGYTVWGNFTSCTQSCGNGTKYRIRNCTNPAPRHGGKNCSLQGPSVDVKTCNVHPCPIDGGYTSWSEFGLCSRSCGRGRKYRTRNCTNPVPQFGGRNCSDFGLAIDARECFLRECPIDGGYTEWSEFSACTRSCNGGRQKRWRTCFNPKPKYGGRDCERLGPASEVQGCNTFPCPVHGGYSEWTGFEPCTRTCGGGKRIRRRSCTSPPPAHGGQNCSGLGPSIDSFACNTEKCPDIVFNLAVNLTSEKWEDGLTNDRNNRANLLILKIKFGVKEIMGEKDVSEVTNFSFTKGSVIAEFSVSLLHFSYEGITPLQDAIYRDGRIDDMPVSPIRLASPDVPVMAPVSITAVNTSSTGIVLNWLPIPLNYSNGPILEYRISFSDNDSNDWMKVIKGENLSAHVTGLKKFTMYHFRMAGINYRGVGVDSFPVAASTDEDTPSMAPLDVTASNRSSTAIYVGWSPIPRQFIHGILMGYHIHYINTDPEGFGDVRKGVHTIETGRTSALIQGLLKFTNYRIQVNAFTVKGDGPRSDAFVVKTEEDVPSRPPANVTGNNMTSTSIEVRWSPIPSRYAHGILLGYNVSFIPTDSRINRRWSTITVNQSAASVVVTNLRKFTKYMVTVEGFTSKGSGIESKTVAITTDEDIPEAFPTNVTGFNQSSTSLFVEWRHIPHQYRNGILLGYKIFYAPKKSDQPMFSKTVNSTRESTTLDNLEKYTWYVIKVAGFTSKGLGPQTPRPLEIRTSEDVPSQPVILVKGRNTSHSSLFVQWDEIPRNFIHGVLLGYRVLFWRYNESRDTYETKQLSTNERSVHLRNLWIYTKYKIQVLGFTAVGEGAISKEIIVSTDEYTPSQSPINVRAFNKTSPTQITVQWNPIPDEFYVHGILRGYKVLYSAITIANENLEELETYEVTVGPSTLIAVLENLTAFTRYEVRVLAFTVKGDGVKSTPIRADTCNCHSTIFTNWWINPPYVDSPRSNKSGIITPILKQAVYSCCGNCTEHGISRVDFTRTATGDPARKSGLVQFKSSFDETTELHFPVYGFMDQTRYLDSYGFVPFVQSPGLALIIIGDEKGTAATLLLKSLALCFPILFLSIAMLWVSSLVLWFVETAGNDRHFPRNVIQGSWEAMWWAFASMTTLGYGDRIPKSPCGRLVCFTWIIMGLIMVTCFNSTMTSLLTARILDKEVSLYGTKIAAIQNSSGYRLAIRKNAKVNPNGKSYTNLQEVYAALTNREVKGMLIDAFTVGSRKELFNRRDLRISKLLDYSSAYGAVLGGEARKLQKCFQEYVSEQRSEISKIVEDNVDSIEVTPKSMSVERSSSLFDPEFPTYINSLIICGVLLVVLWLVGAKFEFAKRMGWIKFKGKAKDQPLPRTVELMRNKAELKSEMSKIVTIFKINCSRRIYVLRQKHKRELLHLAKLKRQAENSLIQKSSFRRDSFFNFSLGFKTPENHECRESNGHTKRDSSVNDPESEMETLV